MSGRSRSSAARGVSSPKTITASTQSSASSTAARSAAGFSGRPSPFSRRTDASELRQTIRQSPRDRAACEQADVTGVQQVEAAAGRHHRAAGRADPARQYHRVGQRGRARRGGRYARVRGSAGPRLRRRSASRSGRCPRRLRRGSPWPSPSRPPPPPRAARRRDSAIAAAAAKRSPAPQVSPACTRRAGTISGAGPPWASSVPCGPRVTATPSTGHRPSSRPAASAAERSTWRSRERVCPQAARRESGSGRRPSGPRRGWA